MGWLVALGVLTALAILPLGISALYDADGPLVRLIIGPVRVKLYPRQHKKKPPKNAPQNPEGKPKSAAGSDTAKKGGGVKDFLPLVRTVLDFLGDLRRKLRVKRLEMKLILASGDPCDLAVNYGKAWAVLGNLMPLLEKAFVIKKRDLEVECDFTSNESLIFARLDLTVTLGRLLCLLVRYGVRAVRQYLNILNTRKGGAKP